MGDVDGGFVSGELLLRSDADNARSLPAKLEERLRSSLSGRAARRRAASSLRRIDVLRRAVRSRVSASSVACACARARGDFLVTHAARGERRGAREAARRERAYRRDLDAKLAALAVRYGAVLVAERRASAAREAEADCERRRALATLEARARLAAFGLHVEHETRGGVALRRLGPADAQWARCRRAAAENARRGFFGADWHFGGLEIVDVYKMENRALLDDFQSRSDALGKKFAEKSGDGDDKPKANLKQVKGLFCGVPSECVARPRPRRVRGGWRTAPRAQVERLCVYGLRDDASQSKLERVFFDDALISLSETPAAPGAPGRGSSSPGVFGDADQAADDDDGAHFGASRTARASAARMRSSRAT